MSNEEFRRWVTEADPSLPTAPLDAAIAHHTTEGKTENFRISECVALARNLMPLFAKDPRSEDDPVSVVLDTSAQHTASELQGAIAPEVGRVRSELWESTSAPFSSWKDASDWLDGLGAREERTAEENARAYQLYTDWVQDRRRPEIEGIMGVEVHVELRAHTIPYVAPGGSHVTHAVVPHGSKFVALESVAKRLANDTGFNEASVVRHILCGLPLVLPSIRITKTLRLGGKAGTVRVEFNSPDVTHAQITNVLKLVREFWGKSSQGRLAPNDVRFLEIVEGLGGVPLSGRKAFFGGVRKACDEEGLSSYKNWRGPYMRWHRLMKRETKLGTKEN